MLNQSKIQSELDVLNETCNSLDFSKVLSSLNNEVINLIDRKEYSYYQPKFSIARTIAGSDMLAFKINPPNEYSSISKVHLSENVFTAKINYSTFRTLCRSKDAAHDFLSCFIMDVIKDFKRIVGNSRLLGTAFTLTPPGYENEIVALVSIGSDGDAEFRIRLYTDYTPIN